MNSSLPFGPQRRSLTELYRYYDETGMLLYVGISLSAAMRLGAHRRHSGWFSKIRTITIEHYPSPELAREAETRAIREEKPLWNIHGRSDTAPPPLSLPKLPRSFRHSIPVVNLDAREKGRLPERARDIETPRFELYSSKVEEAYRELMATAAFNQTQQVTA